MGGGIVLVADQAYAFGQAIGRLLFVVLVGLGVWKLGRRFRIGTPLLVVAVVVAVGFCLAAASISNARTAQRHPALDVNVDQAQSRVASPTPARRHLAASAAPVSPAKYRAAVNAYCRVMLPRMQRFRAKALRGMNTHDNRAYWTYFVATIGTMDGMFQQIHAVPVPTSLRPHLRQTNAMVARHHAAYNQVLSDLRNNDGLQAQADYSLMPRFQQLIEQQYKAAGLRDCA